MGTETVVFEVFWWVLGHICRIIFIVTMQEPKIGNNNDF